MSDEKLPIEKVIDTAKSAVSDLQKAVADNLTFDYPEEQSPTLTSESESES